MNSEEKMQNQRALEISKVISQMDFSKYGYHFDHGSVTKWVNETMGHNFYFIWKQESGPLALKISIRGKFNSKASLALHDSIYSTILDTRNEYEYMILDYFEKEKLHPLFDGHINWSNAPLEEFAKNYEKLLIEALDTYLNDFIMGRRFTPDRFDRGDY